MNAPIVALAALAGFSVGVGFVRSLMPLVVVRAAVVAALATPLLAMGYGAWELARGEVGWPELTLFATLFVLTGFGTTIGYHRLLAHRSFETSGAVKAVLLVLGAMGLPTKPLDFVAHHLKHHAHSDRAGDPHSPLDGLLHAHVGWFVIGREPAERDRYCRHLRDDPVVRFVDRTTMVWVGVGLGLPFLLDGWQGLLWGGLIRLAVSNNATFAVNSIGHRFGSRPFATNDESRNNLLVALVSLGEGWHNNHHAFPTSASHGFGWRQPDASGLVIGLLARLGLVWNVKRVPPTRAKRRRRVAEPA